MLLSTMSQPGTKSPVLFVCLFVCLFFVVVVVVVVERSSDIIRSSY